MLQSPRASWRASCSDIKKDCLPERRTATAGCIQQAEGGTLFLDEVGVLPTSVQVRLLRVLQESEYEPLGGSHLARADVRLVAATSQDLEDATEHGSFREDLYYRISVIPIYLPPLRERRSDILPLVAHFVAEYSPQLSKHVVLISPAAIDLLWAHCWPGNVHELESCIEHAVLLAADGVIRACDLPPSLARSEAGRPAEAASLEPTVDPNTTRHDHRRPQTDPRESGGRGRTTVNHDGVFAFEDQETGHRPAICRRLPMNANRLSLEHTTMCLATVWRHQGSVALVTVFR